MAGPARDEAPADVECHFTWQRQCLGVLIMLASISARAGLRQLRCSGDMCHLTWQAQYSAHFQEWYPRLFFLQERPAKVYWKSSRTGAPQKIVFRECLAKVPQKAALEKRPQHSQTSLESSRQAATSVSHQIESQKTIFQWSLAEMQHKRVTKAFHKNCTRVPPRQKIQQECLPRVCFRSLPDSLPRVSWNVFHEAKASYSPACICHVSNQCKFSLWNVHRHVQCTLSVQCECRFACSTMFLSQRSLKFPWYSRYTAETVEFRLRRLTHAPWELYLASSCLAKFDIIIGWIRNRFCFWILLASCRM